MNHIKSTFQRLISSSNKLVKDMIIAFVGSLKHNARFLQEIPLDIRTSNIPVAIKLDTNEFSLLVSPFKTVGTNREELLFLTVCAFPNDSRMGFA